MSSITLEGKKALITGETRGLGKVFAETLQQAGAEVTITGSGSQPSPIGHPHVFHQLNFLNRVMFHVA